MLGKVGDCQVAVSAHAAGDAASCPLGIRSAGLRLEAVPDPAPEPPRPLWLRAGPASRRFQAVRGKTGIT